MMDREREREKRRRKEAGETGYTNYMSSDILDFKLANNKTHDVCNIPTT